LMTSTGRSPDALDYQPVPAVTSVRA
jgi:hypothetical protein